MTTANNTTKAVPADALRFDAACMFADSDSVCDDLPNVFPISMLARTPEPIDHPYWGRIVHDMEGMQLGDRTSIAIDFHHSDWNVVGYCDDISADTTTGLTLSGGLTSLKKHDDAWNIYHQGKLGVPWRSSIDFRGAGLKLQFVDEGEVAEVNGTTFEGPGYIAREWPLRGVAIVRMGSDPDANTQFSAADDADVDVCIFTDKGKPEPMGNESQKSGNTDDGKVLTDAPGSENTNGGNAGEFKERLKTFVDAFGTEQGTQFALDDSLTFADAKLKFTEAELAAAKAQQEESAKTLSDLQQQNAELLDKFKQLADSNLGGQHVETPAPEGDGSSPSGGSDSDAARVLDDHVSSSFNRLKRRGEDK